MFIESFEEPAPQGIQPFDDDPVELYLRSDLTTRIEILTSHPQVAGFIFLEKNHLTKAFLTKKVKDWSSSPIKDIVAAVTGCPESFTAFSVDDGVLGSDNAFLVESPDLHDGVRTISAAKFLKDNKKKLDDLPEWSDAELKRVKLVAFPAVLPFLKTQSFVEGNLADPSVKSAFCDTHELFHDWCMLKTSEFQTSDAYFELENKCPTPEFVTDITFDRDLPLSVLIRRKGIQNAALDMLDMELKRFVVSPEPQRDSPPVPDLVSLAEKTMASIASSQDSKVVEKNEKLMAFLSVMYAHPTYDRTGSITALSPAILTNEAMELLSSSSSTADTSRNLTDGLEALAYDISRERSYISRATDFPFLSQTLLTYFLQGYCHTGSIEKNPESLKKTFNILALLPPPSNDDYAKYIVSSKNNEVEQVLDHPSDKRSSLKKDVFVKGRQNSLEDVTSFLSNIVAFSRFWVNMSEESCTQPILINMLVEIADYISATDFRNFVERNIVSRPYIPHTIVTYIFNIVGVFIKMAKNRKILVFLFKNFNLMVLILLLFIVFSTYHQEIQSGK